MRYWEIDVARGIAVLLMISYHIILDLFFPYHDYFHFLAILTASMFIFVSGMSLSISYSRGAEFKKFIKRGTKLLLFAMVITAATFLFLKRGFILFGILHFFGVSSFLVYPFLKHSNKRIVLFLGVVSVLIGRIFRSITINSQYLIWLGVTPVNFHTFDFFPIFPWFGLLLIGSYIGSHFYPKGKRGFKIAETNNILSKPLQFLGKRSLIIYFIHQPIILLILYLFWNSEILSLMNI